MNSKILVTVATSNYKNYLYTFLECAKTNLTTGGYVIIVLHDFLSKEIMDQSFEIAKDHFEISFYNINDYPDKEGLGKLIKNPVYWRLIAPYVPDVIDAQRLLYIDLDTLILEDISELFKYPLQGMTVGACIDYLPEIQYGVNNWESLGLNPHAPYFNAGVLLIDLPQYKIKKISDKVIRVVNENEKYLFAFGRWPQNDQYGLNVVLLNDWLILPPQYNYGSELEYKKCKILHYIGNGKPYTRTCKPEFTSEFLKYSKKFN